MEWKKSTIKLTRWEANGYRITETIELDGHPFTLECFHGSEEPPETFDTIEAAKKAADLRNELRVAKEDNARLRAELNRFRTEGTWQEFPTPEDFEAAEAILEEQGDPFGDDGRGIPKTINGHPATA